MRQRALEQGWMCMNNQWTTGPWKGRPRCCANSLPEQDVFSASSALSWAKHLQIKSFCLHFQDIKHLQQPLPCFCPVLASTERVRRFAELRYCSKYTKQDVSIDSLFELCHVTYGLHTLLHLCYATPLPWIYHWLCLIPRLLKWPGYKAKLTQVSYLPASSLRKPSRLATVRGLASLCRSPAKW